MSLLSPALVPAYHALAFLAQLLVPLLGGGGGPAVAIVCFTAGVRLCLHPLNRAQMRAQAEAKSAREALAPKIEKLKRTYKNDPRGLQRETLELYRANNVKLAPGMLQGLVQLPVFLVVYRLFVTPTIAGRHNALLADKLFGVGLGWHLADVLREGADAGGSAVIAHVAVFAVLIAVVALIAAWSSARMRKAPVATITSDAPAAGTAKLVALLPFGTVLSVAILPLASGIYLATTTLWTLVERGERARLTWLRFVRR